MVVRAKIKINQDILNNLVRSEMKSGRLQELGGVADRDIKRILDALVGSDSKFSKGIRNNITQGIVAGLDTVSSVLKTGITPGSEFDNDFRPLSESWVKQKKPESRSLFWRNLGYLHFGFNSYRSAYVLLVAKGETLVESRQVGATLAKVGWRYNLTFKVPPHRLEFMTAITKDSFVTGKAYSGLGSSDGRKNTFAKIGYNEGIGEFSRPFIAKVMAGKGLKFQELLVQDVKQLKQSLS